MTMTSEENIARACLSITLIFLAAIVCWFWKSEAGEWDVEDDWS